MRISKAISLKCVLNSLFDNKISIGINNVLVLSGQQIIASMLIMIHDSLKELIITTFIPDTNLVKTRPE